MLEKLIGQAKKVAPKRKAKVDPNCAGCSFFKPHRIGGVCHRFPAPVEKRPENWCGEFKVATK